MTIKPEPLRTRGQLPNPDHLWPEERTFGDLAKDLADRHDQHIAGIKAFEARLKAWSERVDGIGEVQS